MTSSICCDSSSSWVCIGIYRPRGRLAFGGRTSDELASRISSISHSFNATSGPGFSIKTAVLKSCDSNQVAVFSVWDKGSILEEPYRRPKVLPRKLVDSFHDAILRKRRRRGPYSLVPPLEHVEAFEKALSAVAHLIDVSWYEVSCSDCKEGAPAPSFRSPADQGTQEAHQPSPLVHPFSTALSPTLSYPPPCWESARSMPPSPILSTLSLPSPAHDIDERTSLSSQQSSLASSSSLSAPSQHLSLGDVVHLRCIVSNKPHLEEVLSYSCLAILKAYFPQTDGLLSYAFYRSLNGSRMTAMGTWQSYDAASAFLFTPDGALEERYWRSLGAKTSFGIYEVVALVTG